MKRKSSRGNPNHWPAGSPKGGQFAPKGSGIASNYGSGYYEVRTQYRNGEATKEELDRAKKYYSTDTAQEEPTPKQKRFAEAIAKRLGIDLPEEETKKSYSEFISEHYEEFYAKKKKPEGAEKAKPKPKKKKAETKVMPTDVGKGKDGAIDFTKRCAEAFGANTDGVVFYTKTPGDNNVDGCVYATLVDGKIQATAVAVKSKRDKNRQIHATYHEVFHLARSGQEFDDAMVGKEGKAMEEVQAEVSAVAMCRDAGVEHYSMSYSEEIVSILPRLKQSEKYKDCNTMSDFGKKFIESRKNGENVLGDMELAKCKFNESSYLMQYDAGKYFNEVYPEIVPTKLKNDEVFKMQVSYDLVSGVRKLDNGAELKHLTRDERIVVSACIRRAMEKEGIK